MATKVEGEERVLDATKSPEVQYAIPLWLRDEQIKVNSARVAGRIQPNYVPRTDPVAIVGFGPSLQNTWEKLRDFKYIITCSGSHRFLIDRGVVPTWHVEVDPRDHKIALLGTPHPDVEYLVASACHPAYVEHLAGFNIKLWHVFDGTDEGIRVLPPGEWAVTGGCDVGLRAMSLAAFMGFRDLHVFGLDGSAKDGERHAGQHPNGKQKYSRVEYNGKTFWSTPGMLMAAQQTVHELEQLPAVSATFYGEGLTQEMVRGYQPKQGEPTKPYANLIAFNKPTLITPEYAQLNTRLHQENLAYGVGGGKHASVILKLTEALKTTSVLDYGCGKGYLAKALPFPIWEYDPGVPGKCEAPRPADIVVCTDVLEHIEPDKLDVVLGDLRRVTRKVGYFVIHTGPSTKRLADGRNAHLLQRDLDWWKQKLQTCFTIGKVIQQEPLITILVGPKALKKKKSS